MAIDSVADDVDANPDVIEVVNDERSPDTNILQRYNVVTVVVDVIVVVFSIVGGVIVLLQLLLLLL